MTVNASTLPARHEGCTIPASHEAPALPDGLVVVVKSECATCQLTAPLLQQIPDLTVYTQDDPEFPQGLDPIHDEDLAVSWHHDVETVPTLIRVVDGEEVERTIGWLRKDWQRITGIADLGADLPELRPGCGSMSVDPDKVDELRVRFTAGGLRSRRVELAQREDEHEAMFDRGWTDGLPVVAPTEERVLRMLEGTTRAPDDVVAVIPPDLVETTVEKVAIAAVMAGCRPEYLPWVLTAVEAVCNDEFNMHGALATTMPIGPVIVCSGPGTRAIGMNSAGNALGQGNRANLTIGRAVQLVVRNIGGGRPGEVDRATHGNPGKLSFCFAERADSPIGFLAESRGVTPGADALTVFAGEGPRCIVDQKSREPQSLARSLAGSLRTVHHHKLPLGFDAILVLGPEHARVFHDAGWDRQRILAELHGLLQLPVEEIVQGAGGIAEGIAPSVAKSASSQPTVPKSQPTVPKFSKDGILLAYAGGEAGLFSMIIAGWVNGSTGSTPVTREVRP